MDALIESMRRAAGEVKRWPSRAVRIFHHNDADGLSSGAILGTAFAREGYNVQRACLEKPYPEVLERIYSREGSIIVFADFAGRIAPLISELNRGRNLTLILDHHAAEPASDPRVHNLDPELFGLKGDRDIAAATTCFLFTRELNPANTDLIGLSIVGAVGDKFFVEGRLAGINHEIAIEAQRQGRIEIRGKAGGEQYLIRLAGSVVLRCDELAADLDVLGGAGYYQSGPDRGVKVLTEGPSPESEGMVKSLRATRGSAFEKEIGKLEQGALHSSARIQWFHVGERFSPMGVKTIGSFCEAIKTRGFIDPKKYIAGFQTVPDRIPGFGLIHFGQVKISMRVPPVLEAVIRAGKAAGLNTFLPEATNRVGGFSDACHSLAAATTVAAGKEEELIEEMEKILEES